ncbi:MAG: restriction endonuclease subunit S [Chthoniobacteraceae bacterium]
MAQRHSPKAGVESAATTARGNAARVESNEEDSELPAGWTTATVGEIASVQLGKMLDRTKHTTGELVPYLRNVNVRWGSVETHDLQQMFFEPHEIERYALRQGDLVVCEGGEPGRAAIWNREQPVMFQKALHRVRPSSAVLAEWILVALRRHAAAGSLNAFIGGTTIRHLTRESFVRLPLALPPVAEQRRIVARLEALEARSRRARAALDSLPLLLAQVRQSILASAFRGDLTAGWRAKNGNTPTGTELLAKLQDIHSDARLNARANAAQATEGVHDLSADLLPESWAAAELRDLCHPAKPICYGILMPGANQSEGVPYIRVADFPNDRIRMETVRKTTPEMDAKFSRSRLAGGDLLLSIRGTVGRLAVVPPQLAGANITQDSARLSIHDSVCASFVEAMLRSPDTQQRMQRAVKGVAVRGINIGDVRPLQIPLPPLAEQREIVRRLEAAFARLDAAAAAHAAAVAELDRLDASLLAKAFRGELVPQDPAEESAAVTLQRLRTPREVFDPFAYLFQFIPALLRASDGALPFARALEGCALLRVPRDLVRLLEPIGGAPARQHFERFAQPLNDGSFEPVLRKLIDAGAITHEPRANHLLRLVKAKAPPIALLIAEDARHIASVLALVPAEALEDLAPRNSRKLCSKSAAAVLAG